MKCIVPTKVVTEVQPHTRSTQLTQTLSLLNVIRDTGHLETSETLETLEEKKAQAWTCLERGAGLSYSIRSRAHERRHVDNLRRMHALLF